jgi:hypothetical protein
LKKVANAVGEQFQQYLQDRSLDESLLMNLAARFMAMSSFQTAVLQPPENMAYSFIFLQLLVWEQVAIKYPAECGVPGQSAQMIKIRVNTDLRHLCKCGVDSAKVFGNSLFC